METIKIKIMEKVGDNLMSKFIAIDVFNLQDTVWG